MQDFLGNELKEGDTVAFSDSHYGTSNLLKGVIERFTVKSTIVKYAYPSSTYSKKLEYHTTPKQSYQIVKVTTP